MENKTFLLELLSKIEGVQIYKYGTFFIVKYKGINIHTFIGRVEFNNKAEYLALKAIYELALTDADSLLKCLIRHNILNIFFTLFGNNTSLFSCIARS